LSVYRILLLQQKPKLGRTKPSTGPHPGHGLELAGLEPMCAVKINMPRIFKQENRPKTVAQSALLYLDIVFRLWWCCCFLTNKSFRQWTTHKI